MSARKEHDMTLATFGNEEKENVFVSGFIKRILGNRYGSGV